MSPGAWLTDMCQERYEVREKKSNKKVWCWCCWICSKLSFCGNEDFSFWVLFCFGLMQRPRGLKAMGSMESDSE